MPKLKPTVARTPEALAKALALSATDAKEWQVQYELMKQPKGIGVASQVRRLGRLKPQR